MNVWCGNFMDWVKREGDSMNKWELISRAIYYPGLILKDKISGNEYMFQDSHWLKRLDEKSWLITFDEKELLDCDFEIVNNKTEYDKCETALFDCETSSSKGHVYIVPTCLGCGKKHPHWVYKDY